MTYGVLVECPHYHSTEVDFNQADLRYNDQAHRRQTAFRTQPTALMRSSVQAGCYAAVSHYPNTKILSDCLSPN